MNNVFVVHSNITALSASAVIEQNKIQNPLIILIKPNTFNINIIPNGKNHILPSFLNYLNDIPTYGSNNFPGIFIRLLYLNIWLKSVLLGGKFRLFIPHSKNILFQIFITSKYCLELNYIDEGLLSYTDNFHKIISKKSLSFSRRFFGYFYIKRLNFQRNYKHIYLFVKNPINNHPKTIFLFWPILKSQFLENFSKREILVLDNPVDGEVFSWEDYQLLLNFYGLFFRGRKIYLKHHPRESRKLQIEELLINHGVEVEVLGENISVELLINSFESFVLFGCWSSLLFYAGNREIEVISFLEKVKVICPKSNVWIKKNVPFVFYTSNINFI